MYLYHCYTSLLLLICVIYSSLLLFLISNLHYIDVTFIAINPTSKEGYLIKDKLNISYEYNRPLGQFGFAYNIFKQNGSMPLDKYMLKYKYLIVTAGLVSADRLATLLANSGAVILLQETSFLYHFSARMKPWIHYGMYVH